MCSRISTSIILYTLIGIVGFPAEAAARTARPKAVVYVRKRGKTQDIRYQPIRYGRPYWLTRTATTPTALQCTADGRHVTYAEDGKVFARRIARKGKPFALHTLPKSLWQLHRHQLRTFIQNSPSGRYVALPDAKGILVYDLQQKKSLLIKPPTTAGTQQKVRVIHPARWMPGHDSFVYLTQTGERGPGEVKARVFDLIQGRHTLWFPVLTQKVDAVEAYDAVWNPTSTRVALSLAVRVKRKNRKGRLVSKRRVRIKIFSVNPYKELKLPRRLRVGRVHGFDPKLGDIVFSARLGRSTAKVWSYSFTRKRRRLLAIGYLGSGRMVLRFYPARRTALVAQPGSGRCAGRSKLYQASVRFPMKSLARWSKWNQIVATDPTGAWLIFRSGSTCSHKRPVLYLMQADGKGLMRDMPSRFSRLRKVAPEDASLCPSTRRPKRRRRRRRRRRR